MRHLNTCLPAETIRSYVFSCVQPARTYAIAHIHRSFLRSSLLYDHYIYSLGANVLIIHGIM